MDISVGVCEEDFARMNLRCAAEPASFHWAEEKPGRRAKEMNHWHTNGWSLWNTADTGRERRRTGRIDNEARRIHAETERGAEKE